ncbi:GntR family transcriptional regulator [Aquihabitans sp. G128]|uniref:GntR family transcriptional regulator n=1 Tax=Aquihabitans sp. G128 TaxID=2849779 RepID=UPI001C2421B4|nr:GntR family transcriptional regulator [Aquihabitans sp. G128]QXC61064.1 GntR family transcriptional regulator [Aquihabitans sp. G128]
MTTSTPAWAPHDEALRYETAYGQLRRELLDDTIAPGTRMREVELADRLQVSRTPVREALRRLESDGFVQRTSTGGLVATPTGPDDLGDIGLLRVEIDGLAARLAAARGSEADWERVFALVDQLREAPDDATMAHVHRNLHREIYAIGFSPRMAAFFNAHLLPYIEDAVNVGPGYQSDPEGAYRQHLALVRALSSGDVERAVAASRTHAESGVRYAKTRTQVAEGSSARRDAELEATS